MDISEEISAELARATAKFPTWPTDPFHALAVVGEEYGELQKAVLQHVYEPHKQVTLSDIREEAIQTAAMAARWAMSLDAYRYARGEQHSQAKPAQSLTPQMRRLVIAARRAAQDIDGTDPAERSLLAELDQAAEAFAADVPWDNEPDQPTVIGLDLGADDAMPIVARIDGRGLLQEIRVLPNGATAADIERALADLRRGAEA